MSKQVVEAKCPGCKEVVSVNVDVPDPAVQIKEDTTKVDALTRELSTLKGDAEAQARELEDWQSMSKHRPVGEILQHLADCPNCRPQLDEYVAGIRKKAIAEVTPEQAKEIARSHKLWPPPTIDLGLTSRAIE